MTTNLKKIPATIVTGFLGSGKTTLLSNILKQAKGKRIAVIVNEFGELDIDADLLRNCPLDCDDEEAVSPIAGENGIYELANGCICCTVEEEFLPVMQELVKRRDDIDHILIETSGLALPKPLVQAFNWPEIKQHCTVDAVITLIDGPAVSQGRFANNPELVQQQREADESLDHDPSLKELLDDQLSAADLVVVSKNDLLDDKQKQNVQAILKEKLSDSVKVVYLEQGVAPLDVLMGIDAKTEDHINHVHNHHDHHHEHGAHHEHAHDHFDSFVLNLGELNIESLKTNIETLIKQYNIFRIKGFVNTGKPMRQVIQVVGKRVDTYFDRKWEEGEAKTSLVFIGKDLDQTKIEAVLNS
ncbi:cobalamin biosynthesis protein CobW [Marinicellulosiphila megalodicopiae]|uniref:cobalamin biosynthesis protein CobW n=1 Tax=Marinicellulosiphila megalodicopiae TaxID=2724896 RepID=UPI003BAFBE09